jgi:hypothetical protein
MTLILWKAPVVGATIAGAFGFIDADEGRTCAEDAPPL